MLLCCECAERISDEIGRLRVAQQIAELRLSARFELSNKNGSNPTVDGPVYRSVVCKYLVVDNVRLIV